MRSDEAFVCEALVRLFGGPEIASPSDGEDPPDFYLTFNNRRIAVEVTQLTPIAIGFDGSIGNRLSQDLPGLRIIEYLETTVGTYIPEQFSLLVGIEAPIARPTRVREELHGLIEQLIPTLTPETEFEVVAAESKTTISVMPRGKARRKIIGYVANEHSSPNILMNAEFIIEDRIRSKLVTCSSIAETTPIWLAMLNNYWLADGDTYQLALRNTRIRHCFERMFAISELGAVTELSF